MQNTKVIINGSNPVQAPVAAMIADKVVAQVKSQYGSSFPTTQAELDAYFEPKKAKIERHTSLNFAKKKDKFRDMMCDLFFDIDGYQAFKGIWVKAFNDALPIINQAIDSLPETVFLSRCDHNDVLVLLEDMSINLEIGRHEFIDVNPIVVNSEDDEYMDGWRNLTSEEDDMLSMAYMATNIAVDTGHSSCGGSQGFGSLHDDARYINDNFGLGYIGDHSNYHAVTCEENAVMIIEAKRVVSIDDVMSEFVKRMKAL